MRRATLTFASIAFLAAFCFVALPEGSADDLKKEIKIVTINKDVAPIF